MPVPPEINSALISGLASIITALIGLIIRAIENPMAIKKALDEAKKVENNENSDASPL